MHSTAAISLHRPDETASSAAENPRAIRRPRLGFVGVGWIGLHRMRKLIEADVADVACLADACTDALRRSREFAPQATAVGTLEEVLAADLDGVVIATPSALHAEQTLLALDRGMAVFCQKPLARTAEECRRVVSEARDRDCLLGVDFSYRHVRGVSEMRHLIHSGLLGKIFLADLTFHNAYGPDKDWFYDPRLSGGGCVTDLGIHLIDLAGWLLDQRAHSEVRGTLWHRGDAFPAGRNFVAVADAASVGTDAGSIRHVEDAAIADWQYANGTTARLACSWHLSAGQDAVIEAAFYGTKGAVALRNVNGSFYDFTVEHRVGTRCTQLAGPPDEWGGRALVAWAERLAAGNRFDPEIEHAVTDAELIDAIYGR